MSHRPVLESQQSVTASSAGRSAAGSWTLGAGRALSLHPAASGVLAIACGRAWVTAQGPGAGCPGTGVDHVLRAGDELAIAPGQHVVLEAWSPPGRAADAVAFRWDVPPASLPATCVTRTAACDWECGVVQPLRDLLRALGLGGRAVGSAALDVAGAGGRLAAGAVRFALYRIAAPLHRRPV